MSDVTIRELTSESAQRAAFPVVKQLRTHLDEDTYREYLATMTADGYRLFGLFVEGDLAAVAGVGVATTMYYGRHLWVYELVTDADHRSRGYGTQLLAYLEEVAEREGCAMIALSSGLGRADAHRFYEDRAGMERASYVYTKAME